MAVTTIKEKLEEAARIKNQIRTAAATKDVDFPENTPFADYPGMIASIPGHLQVKTITPTAEGGEIGPDEGYDGFSRVTLPAEPDLTPKSIITGKSIFGVAGTAEAPTFDIADLLGRTLTELTAGAPKIGAYAFYNFSALKKCTFQNLTEVGNYAFYGCSGLQSFVAPLLKEIAAYAFQNCSALSVFDLSNVERIRDYGLCGCRGIVVSGTFTVPTIDQYGAQYLGTNVSAGFVYAPSQPAVIGHYALQYAKLTDVTGEIKSIGNYGLANLSSQFTKFSGKINGSIATYGFSNNQYLREVDFSQSKITSIGTYAFYYLGWSRTNYSTQRMTLDFRNSVFDTVDQYAFGYVRYTDIFLPAKVKTINAYAFYYDANVNIYMGDVPAPTLAATTCFSNASNYKVFAPYNYLHSYVVATNWSSISANIIGYAPAGKWEAGAELPTANGEGYALTWYSDIGKTTQVTTVPEGSPELYCSVGNKVSAVISVSMSDAAALQITDADGNSYDYSEGFILVNTGIVLTVNVVVPEGYTSYLAIGGEKITEYPYSFTVEDDMAMKVSAWDPSAINPDFENASWEEIAVASASGNVADVYGSYVGTIREITLKNGKTVKLRLANCTNDMYEKADGSGSTGLVLEFVDLWPDNYYMNSSSTNAGGWDASYMRNTVMPLIWEQLPDDLKSVIATVKVKAAKSGNDGTIVESADTLFLPAEREIFGTNSRSRVEEWNALQRWQYYAQNDTNAARIKQRSGSAAWWWLRSPRAGSSIDFVFVTNGGSVSYNGAYYAGGVAPGFCI